jgi:hypothetical protein
MLSREDVERITKNLLNQLRLEVDKDDWTMPNTRIVKLMLGQRVLSQTSFDVVQKREYEG